MENKIKPKAASESLQAIFDEGTRIGEETQKLFPGGKLIKYICFILGSRLLDHRFYFLINFFYAHILNKRYPHIHFVKLQLQNPLAVTPLLNPQAYKQSISLILTDTE